MCQSMPGCTLGSQQLFRAVEDTWGMQKLKNAHPAVAYCSIIRWKYHYDEQFKYILQ